MSAATIEYEFPEIPSHMRGGAELQESAAAARVTHEAALNALRGSRFIFTRVYRNETLVARRGDRR